MPWAMVADLISLTQQAVPWAIPLLLFSLPVAVVGGLWAQRAYGASAWAVAALVLSAALVIGFTLTPNEGATGTLVDPRSDHGLWGYLREPEYWLHVDSRSLNVALFVPLGITVALLTRGWPRWLSLPLGLALPWIVEGLQALLPFQRDPQVADLADNSTGYILGWLLGLALSALAPLPRTRVSDAV